MSVIFVVSPFKDATPEEMTGLKKYCTKVLYSGDLPIAPHLYFPQFLEDTDKNKEKVRARLKDLIQGLEHGLHMEIHVLGDRMTQGMKDDITLYTSTGEDIPMDFVDFPNEH